MPTPHPVHGATVLLTVAIPRHTYATLQALASADAACSLDWLARFALMDFARHYAALDARERQQDGAAVAGVRHG